MPIYFTGASTPGGSDTQLQRNAAGVFGGISGATSDGTTLTATSPRVVTSILDANGNPLFALTATVSAVYGLTLANAALLGTVALGVTAPTAAADSVVGTPLSLTSQAAVAGLSNAGAAAGGAVTITSGAAARLTSGNADGGNIDLVLGTGIGTGVTGRLRWNVGGNFNSIGSNGFSFVFYQGTTLLATLNNAGNLNITTSMSLAGDVFLQRDAANVLAQRNGANAQRGDIDNTWTSATNKEGFKVDWITTANVCELGVFKGSGGGTARQADWMSPDGIVALRFQMGFGTGRAPNIGTANVNTTAVGNVDAGEDVLMTYSMPLASFITATKRVHITAWGNSANNANSKTLKLYFGSVILTNALTISIAGIWRIEADVVSTGTDAQDYVAQLVTTGTAGVALNDIEQGSLTEDDGAAIVIKCTGEGVATDDIIQQGMIVTFGN